MTLCYFLAVDLALLLKHMKPKLPFFFSLTVILFTSPIFLNGGDGILTLIQRNASWYREVFSW